MAQTTGIRDHAPSRTPQAGDATLGAVGSKLRLVASRSVFWAYERGSWQYDLIVLAILGFIFLIPRSWYSDRPTLQLSDLRHRQGIIELGRVNKGVRYLVDARLVESLELKPEDAVPVILKQRLQRPFTVKAIDPVRDRNQVVLGYTVVVEE